MNPRPSTVGDACEELWFGRPQSERVNGWCPQWTVDIGIACPFMCLNNSIALRTSPCSREKLRSSSLLQATSPEVIDVLLYFIVEASQSRMGGVARKECWTLVLLDCAALLHEKTLLCVQRIIACGTTNGSFKLLCDLVAPNVNTHKGRVVFEGCAHHLAKRSHV